MCQTGVRVRAGAKCTCKSTEKSCVCVNFGTCIWRVRSYGGFVGYGWVRVEDGLIFYIEDLMTIVLVLEMCRDVLTCGLNVRACAGCEKFGSM
jgi:hypothetical protein